MSGKDLVEDPHLNERGFFTRLSHPEVGARTHMGMPWLLTHGPNGVRTPAPLLGQDTDQVLREVLDYSLQTIASLKDERVLY
jgi:crotonobetainyl-CoA:carnitine CoA-transferase CaiB-like acyl-CoA transferase